MDFVDQIVGAQINARRTALGVSLEHLSDKTGISCKKIHAYETARSRVPASLLVKLADALEVEAAFFFFLPEETAGLRMDEPCDAVPDDRTTIELTTWADRAMKAFATIKSETLREAAVTILEELSRIENGRAMSGSPP